MSLLALSGTNSVSGGYDIDNSCMFNWNGTNNAGNGQSYMYDTSWTGTPTSTTTGCFSTWFKNSLSGSTNSAGVASFVNNYSDVNNRSYIMGDWGSGGDFVFGQKVSGSWNFRVVSNALFRDPAAHYHFFAVWDTSNSTESERIRLYVNGERITSLSSQIYPSQNQECYIVSKEDFSVGRAYSSVYGNFTHGYMAETHFVDGTAYAPTDFGEFDEDSGIWKPKQVSVSYGNKGFYLDYKDASNLGNDVSGNNRDLTLSDIDSTNQATDTPTNNFCTLNPLYNYAYGNTITEGATKIYGAANNWGGGKASFGLTSGKWYWEIKQLANGNTFMGLQTDGEDNISSGNAQSQNTSVVFYTDGTLQYSNGSESTTSAPNSIVANSIVGFALDLDSSTQTIKVYLNGSLITAFGSSGTANLSTYNLADKTVFPFVALYDRTVNMNFGGYTVSSISSAESDANGYGTFEYAPPSGYYALCTKNLAEYG